jgi:protein TonB
MFEQYTIRQPRRLLGYGVFSVVLHVAAIGLLAYFAGTRAKEQIKKVADVAFVMSKPGAPPPPPPPPKHSSTVKKTQVIPTRVDPKPIEAPKEIPKEEPAAKPEVDEPDEPGAQEGGVAGGVAGGVPGGVVGGVVGSTGDATAPPKPKNVPPFVIAKDMIAQPLPHTSEVFKASHRNSPPIAGMYRVCVGMDGHVYEVTATTSIPGADADIIQQLKDSWLYKPQQVPVCFLYRMVITVTQ